MLLTNRIPIAKWTLRALSLMTLVALVVAPACAPLCAAQNCHIVQRDGAGTVKCHGSGALDEAPLMHAFGGCGSSELPAVVFSRTSVEETSSLFHLGAPDGKFVADEQAIPGRASAFSDSYLGPPHEFAATFVPASTVLRI